MSREFNRKNQKHRPGKLSSEVFSHKFFYRSAANINPSSSIPGADDITRVELDNGITILARSNFSSLSVSVGGYLAVGGLFDTDDKFIEYLLNLVVYSLKYYLET